METLLKYKQALEKDGYNVLYIALYGSQNYGVSDEYSDIDAKAIVLPKIDDIVFKRNISFVKEFDNGACDVKDLITFYNVVRKGNIYQPTKCHCWEVCMKNKKRFYTNTQAKRKNLVNLGATQNNTIM